VLDDVSPRSSPPLPVTSESVLAMLAQELADACAVEQGVVSHSGSDGRVAPDAEPEDQPLEPIMSDSGSEGGVVIYKEWEAPPAESEHEGGVETADQPAESGQDVNVAPLPQTENRRPRDWDRRRSQSVSDADTKLTERVVRLRYDSLWHKQ
jgi:hypothetical protein